MMASSSDAQQGLDIMMDLPDPNMMALGANESYDENYDENNDENYDEIYDENCGPYQGVPYSSKRSQRRREEQRAKRMTILANRFKAVNDKFSGMPPLPQPLPADHRNHDSSRVFAKWCRTAESVAKGELTPGPGLFSAEPNFLTSTMVRAACKHPSLELFTFFARDLGWYPNQALEDGDVALNLVIEKMYYGDHEDVVKFLLDEGADPNLGRHPDFFGESEGPTDRKSGIALNTAAWACSPQIFDLLLAKGAKLEHATPLHWAVWARVHLLARRTKMIKHLVKLGVDMNGTDERQVEEKSYRVGRPLDILLHDDVEEEGEAASVAAKQVTELLLKLGVYPGGRSASQPTWYPELVERVKARKGPKNFWEGVQDAANKALPYWRPCDDIERRVWVGKDSFKLY